MPTYRYLGQRFKQAPEGIECVLFLVPAEELQAWAGPPQKSSKFMKGFQRAEDLVHWNKIVSFFKESDANVSPTALVVALKAGHARVKAIPVDDLGDHDLVWLEVDFEEPSKDLPLHELAILARDELLAAAGITRDQLVEESNAEEGAENGEDAGTEDEDEENDEERGELVVSKSHLAEFVRFLESPSDLEKEAENPENRANLIAMLRGLVRPGTIVDGQHRTKAAAFLERRIPFPAVAMIDASWKEQVFQFVVINQKAKPIPAEFLSAIISSSLSEADIQFLEERLEQADIKLEKTRVMDLVHGHQSSPFQGMVDFRVQGASGKLKYNGMLTLARRFRTLSTHKRGTNFAPFFKQVFQNAMQGRTYRDRRIDWKEGQWFFFFCGFWSKVRESMCRGGFDDLWEPGQSNLLKVVALQEVQNVFLQWLFERRDPVNSVQDFQVLAAKFLANVQPAFFSREWKLTSLQSAPGRKHLRQAFTKATQNDKYNYDDPLFEGLD